MCTYKYDASPDPFCYPGSNVLINKYGIKNADRLSAVEREITARKMLQLLENPIHGRFGFTHLKNIHKHIFSDLYDWAGTIRTFGFISKSGTIFCRGEHIDQEARRIFGALASENKLRSLPDYLFVERLAYYVSEINALHPFREGNGRVLREFTRQLAMYNGYTLMWSRVPKDEILPADIAAFAKNYKPLIEVLNKALGLY